MINYIPSYNWFLEGNVTGFWYSINISMKKSWNMQHATCNIRLFQKLLHAIPCIQVRSSLFAFCSIGRTMFIRTASWREDVAYWNILLKEGHLRECFSRERFWGRQLFLFWCNFGFNIYYTCSLLRYHSNGSFSLPS